LSDAAAPVAVPRRILPAIVLSQFAGTALWFATNGVMTDLQRQWGLPPSAVGDLTSAVQLGFIAGTLAFALLTLADRFSPRRVFMTCAALGAAANAAALVIPPGLGWLLASRFATGVFLAGIYPVGMKIASGWYRQGLGAALGFMVGALVLGTALPHGVRALGAHWPWTQVVLTVSGVALAGGVLMLVLVPDGPYLARGAKVDGRALGVIWRDPKLRASAFGYFGHMWELYAVLVVVPALIARYLHTDVTPGVSAMAFLVIGAGAIGCAAGGLVALRVGSARVAAAQLACSGLCCLAAPWMMQAAPPLVALWLLLWGATVAGDSPQFSTLTAQNAPRELVGSVLTFVNCVGFTISIVTIQAVTLLARHHPLEQVLPWLALGPLVGLWSMRRLLRR
jgi:MFS family permease